MLLQLALNLDPPWACGLSDSFCLGSPRRPRALPIRPFAWVGDLHGDLHGQSPRPLRSHLRLS